MNRELLSQAIGGIDERFIAEAYRDAPEDASASSERIVHMKAKRIVTFLIAAVLLLALGVTAYAAQNAVGSPQAAEKLAREQLQVWKDMGLISQEVNLDREAFQIYEMQEQTGSDYWYGRLFRHSYDVRWALESIGSDGNKYGGCLRVDTLSGKITNAILNAQADEDAVPVSQSEMEVSTPEGMQTVPIYFYDNFTDIFSADMTVDRFCSLLADYWGFTGYRLADTVDEAWYDAHWEAADGATLLKDLPAGNYYLTVFFEGDQSGAPMYIQLEQFPGYVTLEFGTRHLVG